MEIAKILGNQKLFDPGNTKGVKNFQIRRLSAEKSTDPSKFGSFELVEEGRGQFTSDRLEAIHSRLNSIAKSIRFVDRTMELTEKYIEQMKGRLKRIVKHYPPFPPGSEERVKLLRSFNAFRKLIDQLTIPPREEFAKKIMADPTVVPGAGDWRIVLEDSGSHKTIHSQQIHTGCDGLNIPEIPEAASEEGVHASIENLDAALETLRQRRIGLAADATSLGSFGNGLGSDELSERSTELKSAELGDRIASEPFKGLTKAHSKLMAFLN
jgi:hypothetical protein